MMEAALFSTLTHALVALAASTGIVVWAFRRF